LLDISVRKDKPGQAIVYLDGADARLFNLLVSRLGSEEAAQNAVILVGLLAKLEKNGSEQANRATRNIHSAFRNLVGMSLEELNELVAGRD
jgi:hypothetical protein